MSSAELIDEWHDWMGARGLAVRTMNDRIEMLGRFERDVADPLTASWRDLAKYLRSEQFGASTRQTYHTNFRQWYQWLVRMEYRVDDPTVKLPSPRGPRRLPRPITMSQLGQILNTRMHRRTRIMVLLACYAGLRVSEIAHVRGDDFRGGSVRVTGKGGVTADIPVHPVLAAIAETMPASSWWFPSHVKAGQPIIGQSVSAMISKLMHRAGVRGTPHCLRHFYGTECLRVDGNLVVVQELMRHASVATTALYTKIEDTQRRATIAALPVPQQLRVVA